MQEEEMITTLRKLCAAYMRNDKATIQLLEPRATEIGHELDRKGGFKEMQRVFNKLGGIPGSRTLEMHWDGIGEWSG